MSEAGGDDKQGGRQVGRDGDLFHLDGLALRGFEVEVAMTSRPRTTRKRSVCAVWACQPFAVSGWVMLM